MDQPLADDFEPTASDRCTRNLGVPGPTEI